MKQESVLLLFEKFCYNISLEPVANYIFTYPNK